jgi:HK97 family phage prohead protease
MPNKREIRFQPARELRVQTSPDGSRTISGYAAVYNSSSVGLPWIEKVAPGAFADALKADADVLCLRDHKQEILLGRTTARTLTLTDDTVGLRFSCKMPQTSQASDLAESIDRKDLDGVSFGFSVVDGGDTWSKDSAGNPAAPCRFYQSQRTAVSNPRLSCTIAPASLFCLPCRKSSYKNLTMAILILLRS